MLMLDESGRNRRARMYRWNGCARSEMRGWSEIGSWNVKDCSDVVAVDRIARAY